PPRRLLASVLTSGPSQTRSLWHVGCVQSQEPETSGPIIYGVALSMPVRVVHEVAGMLTRYRRRIGYPVARSHHHDSGDPDGRVAGSRCTLIRHSDLPRSGITERGWLRWQMCPVVPMSAHVIFVPSTVAYVRGRKGSSSRWPSASAGASERPHLPPI